MSTGYRDYGYRSEAGNWSDSYLIPQLKRMLGNPRGPVLDIGCGNGAIARVLLDDGYDVYGIDASRSGIEIARACAADRFFLHDLTEEVLPDPIVQKRFVAAISTEVIAHLYSPRDLLRLARRVLVGGGELIVSTPYHGYLKNLALAIAGRMDEHFGALWDGGIIKFFSRRTLEHLLREEGFAAVEFRGTGRAPLLWKSMLIKARMV